MIIHDHISDEMVTPPMEMLKNFGNDLPFGIVERRLPGMEPPGDEVMDTLRTIMRQIAAIGLFWHKSSLL
jgi:hypothetical protein